MNVGCGLRRSLSKLSSRFFHVPRVFFLDSSHPAVVAIVWGDLLHSPAIRQFFPRHRNWHSRVSYGQALLAGLERVR